MRGLFFILGDAAANLGLGALIGGAAAWSVTPAWNMVPAMAAGMAAGMVISMVFTPIAGIWLGAHEAMIPAMTSGMAAGMVVPMRAVMGDLAFTDGSALGAATALAALLFTYFMNAFLRGERRYANRGEA